MEYTLILLNAASKKTLCLTLTDRSASRRYYLFDFTGSYDAIAEAIGTGEGEYFVCPAGTDTLEGATVLDRGTLQIGEIERTDTATYNIKKEYTQYGG